MFSPRLCPLKGHERLYDSCKMNHIYFVQSSTDVVKICTYVNLRVEVLMSLHTLMSVIAETSKFAKFLLDQLIFPQL